MEYEEIIEELKSMSNPEVIAEMANYGIKSENAFGVTIPNLKEMAKKIGKNHTLAQQLWESDIRETRILASMIDEPEMVTEEQMENWVKNFDYWEICDQCCLNLFKRTKFAFKKCIDWSSREEEFVKRAGFLLMAILAVSDKQAKDEEFEKFFPIIKKEANDNRNFVKKAVNIALKQIGKRNLTLNGKAFSVAEDIQNMDSLSAKWIASDVIKEITSVEVCEKLQNKKN